MADGGFDPCECICNHESAMQRLLNMIRSSQSHCTDNQCFGPLPGAEGADGGLSMMWIMILWIVVAVVMFLMRPRSMRGGKSAPVNDEFDRHGGGDSPPVH